MSIRIPTPAVLRNRGIPATVHRLVSDERGTPVRPYTRAFTGDEASEPVMDEVWVQMTNGTLADIEDPEIGFGSLDNWQAALDARPYKTYVRTLAICLELWIPGQSSPSGAPVPDDRRVGKMMLDGALDEYSTVIGGAFLLASGGQPERVGEVLAAGIRSGAELRAKLIDEGINAILAEETERQETREATEPAAETTDTPGTSGSPSGSSVDSEPLGTSGDSPQPSSSSS